MPDAWKETRPGKGIVAQHSLSTDGAEKGCKPRLTHWEIEGAVRSEATPPRATLSMWLCVID